ncbi:MAG: hypothetical protein Q7T54_02580 [Candidatus Levybacteria bacterium]|nr:hypothetical protein [Candidatus Levybacteria bacterium]
METTEMPMSSNVPVAVGVDAGINDSFSAESAEMSKPIVGEEHVEEEPKETVIETSDQILFSAKNEGFEETLIHLAEGDFDPIDKKEVGDTVEREVELTTSGPEKRTAESSESAQLEFDPEDKTDEVPKDNEQDVVGSRVKDLETQVINLEEKNKNLLEKIQSLESSNTLAMQTLLEMTMVLHEMAKDEEDEEKKATMLEVLVDMMASLMKAMFVPEDNKRVEGVAQSGINHQEVVRKGSKKRSIDEIVKKLRKEGAIRSESQTHQEGPQQESMQQAA